jgi:hypothetical protein
MFTVRYLMSVQHNPEMRLKEEEKNLIKRQINISCFDLNPLNFVHLDLSSFDVELSLLPYVTRLKFNCSQNLGISESFPLLHIVERHFHCLLISNLSLIFTTAAQLLIKLHSDIRLLRSTLEKVSFAIVELRHCQFGFATKTIFSHNFQRFPRHDV